MSEEEGGVAVQFKIAMGTITKFKVEKDAFYQDGKKIGIREGIQTGIREGKTQKSVEVVENLILKLGLSDEQTADVARVSLTFVKKIRQGLAAKA